MSMSVLARSMRAQHGHFHVHFAVPRAIRRAVTVGDVEYRAVGDIVCAKLPSIDISMAEEPYSPVYAGRPLP